MYIEAVLRNYEDTQVPISQDFRNELSLKTDEELENIFHKKYAQVNQNADISTRKRLIRAIEIGKWKLESVDWKKEVFNLFLNRNEIVFGIDIAVEIRRERITKRLHNRLENGLMEEVKSLLESGISAEKLIFYGLEYKFITKYLVGVLSYDEMTKRLEIAIHQFAKRQMTFFRSMERKGLKINWLDGKQTVAEMTTQLLIALNH
jgi:tRNA dimethylallyltransferase